MARPVMTRRQQKAAEAGHWRWEAQQEARRDAQRRRREQGDQQRKDNN